jgi:hypothetical protein
MSIGCVIVSRVNMYVNTSLMLKRIRRIYHYCG